MTVEEIIRKERFPSPPSTPPRSPGLKEQPRKRKRVPNLQNSQFRHDYFARERRKAKRNALQAREWRVFQLEREERAKEFSRQLEVLEQEDDHRKEIAQIEQKTKFREEYLNEIERMQQLRELRRKQREERKEQETKMKEKPKDLPLFKKIEERYKKKIELPKIESERQRLAQLKQYFSPISRKDIEKHTQWYRENRRHHKVSTEMSPKNYTYSNSKGASLLRQDKKYLEEEAMALQLRLQLLDKQKRYAHNVKEMFSPTVDRFKQIEIELRKEKLVHPIRKDPFKRSTDRDGFSDTEYKHEWRPRKFSPNPMVPLPPPEKEIKVRDYLREMKVRKRSPAALSEGNYTDKKFFAFEADRKLKKREASLAGASLNDDRTIKQNEDVNSMLINTIKAKLAALESYKSDK